MYGIDLVINSPYGIRDYAFLTDDLIWRMMDDQSREPRALTNGTIYTGSEIWKTARYFVDSTALSVAFQEATVEICHMPRAVAINNQYVPRLSLDELIELVSTIDYRSFLSENKLDEFQLDFCLRQSKRRVKGIVDSMRAEKVAKRLDKNPITIQPIARIVSAPSEIVEKTYQCKGCELSIEKNRLLITCLGKCNLNYHQSCINNLEDKLSSCPSCNSALKRVRLYRKGRDYQDLFHRVVAQQEVKKFTQEETLSIRCEIEEEKILPTKREKICLTGWKDEDVSKYELHQEEIKLKNEEKILKIQVKRFNKRDRDAEKLSKILL